MNANGTNNHHSQSLAFERDVFADLSFLRNRALMLAVLASCMNGILYKLATFAVTYYTSPITVRVLGVVVTVIGIVLFQRTN